MTEHRISVLRQALNDNSIKKIALIVLIILPVLLQAQISPDQYNPYLAANNPVVFVTAKDWNATQGSMQLYQRANNRQAWKMVRHFEVTLGRNGLAPDRQSLLPKPATAAVKQEGDGKSPAGIFGLGPVFSYHSIKGLKMSFKQVDTTDICVDDVHSAHYNTLVNTDTASNKDWKSFEHMKPADGAYEYGVWVKYNSDKIFSGNGSCIFLHVWAGNTSPTAGCTAMEKQNIIALIHWLDDKQHPALLQLVDSR